MNTHRNAAIVSCTIILIAFLVHMFSLNYARHAYASALQPILGADSISSTIAAGYKGTTQTELIKKQYYIYTQRKAHYNTMMRTYYSNYYALNITLIVFTTLSTIFLFITAKSGWDSKSLLQKVCLLTIVFIASVAYLTQNVMNVQQNIKHNLNGYIYTTKQQLLILKNLNQCNLDSGYVCSRMDTIVAGNYDSLVNNLQYFFDMDGSKLTHDPLSSITGN